MLLGAVLDAGLDNAVTGTVTGLDLRSRLLSSQS
jgi:hypothetical protein